MCDDLRELFLEFVDAHLVFCEIGFLLWRGKEDAGWRGDVLVDVEAVFVDRIEEGVELVVVTS